MLQYNFTYHFRKLGKPSAILYMKIMKGSLMDMLVKVDCKMRLWTPKSWKLSWSESSHNIYFSIAWENIQVEHSGRPMYPLPFSFLGTLCVLFSYLNRFICQIINSLRTGKFLLFPNRSQQSRITPSYTKYSKNISYVNSWMRIIISLKEQEVYSFFYLL